MNLIPQHNSLIVTPQSLFTHIFRVALTSVLINCTIATEAIAAVNPTRSSVRKPTVQVALEQAKASFAVAQYDKAIDSYKRYLSTFPQDYLVWGQLGAAYYHAGQPRTAQRMLQRVERLSPDRSYVYYYQGLCFSVLGLEATAQKYWEYAGWFSDEYGARSTAELIASTYKMREDGKARFLAQSYLQRFPSGAHRQLAMNILKSFESGKRIEDIKVSERPDPDLTVYKYSPYSLFHKPHFWIVQMGLANSTMSGYEPTFREGLLTRESDETSLIVNASLGIGPIRQELATAFAGYAYKQRWYMDSTTLSDWMSNPFDLEIFPLRGDQLARTHQLFGDVRRKLNERLFLGFYSRLEFSRIGTSFFPSSNDDDLKIVLSLKDTQLNIPWVGFSWNESFRTMFYLYLRKEIHNNSPDHSNKTYDFTGASGDQAVSLGITNAFDLPSWRLSGSFDLFQYESIFNDYWLDYTRQGLLINLDYNVWKRLNAFLNAGTYRDNYKLPRIKQGDCSTVSERIIDGLEGLNPVSNCDRSDSGTLMQLGIYWNQTANLRFSGSYQMVESSSEMKEYSETINTIRLDATWAFPGVKRVTRMAERFVDSAFARDDEQ
jgi:hypothetical protein